MAIFPLVNRGTSLGVLEITAPSQAVDEHWGVLAVLADQAAIRLENLSQLDELRRQVETWEGMATLGRELVAARDPAAAVKLAARFIAGRLDLPVAAWISTGNSGCMELNSVVGLGSRKRKELHGEMAILPAWSSLQADERDGLVRRFGEALGTQDAATVEDAGGAVLLVAHAPESLQPTLDAVGSLLEGVLPYLAIMARAEQRNRQLHMGIAWTAHELRAPLMDVKAVLELLLQDPGNPGGLGMLRRSLIELEELIAMTEGFLGWAVGQRLLHRRTADVVKVISDAIRSCELRYGNRMTVAAPIRAMARIDPGPFRRAVENVLRNALACSDPGSKVAVSVQEEEEEDAIVVSIRDRGPRIPTAEGARIFDPFVTGTVSRSRSGNAGLGLFIARSVVEAHGGRIWVDSDRRGATFHLMVPTGLERARRPAS